MCLLHTGVPGPSHPKSPELPGRILDHSTRPSSAQSLPFLCSPACRVDHSKPKPRDTAKHPHKHRTLALFGGGGAGPRQPKHRYLSFLCLCSCSTSGWRCGDRLGSERPRKTRRLPRTRAVFTQGLEQARSVPLPSWLEPPCSASSHSQQWLAGPSTA